MQTVAPGGQINYTITITNNGTSDATNVSFADTIPTNTTLVPGSIVATPIANADTYNVIGNVRIQPNAAAGLLTNDFNPDNGNTTGITASGPTTSTQGGNVTVNADGSFSYNPAPGFTGTDTFTYTLTVTATGKTDTAQVTLNVGNGTATPGTAVIWFVNSAAGSNGDGRLTSPFNCLRGPACFDSTTTGGAADEAGDTIFLYNGSYTGGLTLLANQKLIGQGASDTLVNLAGVTVPTGSDALPATNSNPDNVNITTAVAATNGITLGTGNTLRGFNVGNTTGAKIFGSSFGTLTAGSTTTPDLRLSGTGQALNLTTGTLSVAGGFTSVTTTSSTAQGINLSNVADSDGAGNNSFSFGSTSVSGSTSECILVGTTTSADINFGNTSCTGGTNGVSLQNNSSGTRSFGTLNVSGGSGSAFFSNGGGNVTVTGAATLGSNGIALNIQGLATGTTMDFMGGASITKTTSGNAGFFYNGSNSATITFSALSITTSTCAGMDLNGVGTINVTNGTGTINSSNAGGTAVKASGVTLNANFASVSATNSSASNAINLANVSGTSNFGGGAIMNPGMDAILISGGDGSITYNGSITSTTPAVNLQNKTGGTINFGGAISVTGGGSAGIFLNSNTGATINFTGGISLSTGANAAFTATGGGTVSATQNNTTIVNTLTTTTGTALNVSSTTIGASGLTFRSINAGTAASGPTNGIILNSTGSNGSLTVTGNSSGNCGGVVNSSSPVISDCTGGTIQKTTGTGIFLTNTKSPSFTRMYVFDAAGDGIKATTTSGISVISCNLESNGDTTSPDEANLYLLEVYGTATITNTWITNSFETDLRIENSNTTNGSLTANISGTTVINNGGSGQVGNLFNFLGDLTANMTLNLSNSRFSGNQVSGALTVDGVHAITSGGTMDVEVSGSTFQNNFVAIGLGLGGSANSKSFTYDVHDNPTITGSAGSAINVTATAGKAGDTFIGKIRNNFIGTNGVANSGSVNGFGMDIDNESIATYTSSITGNTIREIQKFDGIFARQVVSAGSTSATITGNNISINNVNASNVFDINTAITIAGGTMCSNISGNTLAAVPFITTRLRVRRTAGTHNITQAAPTAAVNAAELDDANGINGLVDVQGTNTFSQPPCVAPSALESFTDIITPTSLPSAMSNSAPVEQPAQVNDSTSQPFVVPQLVIAQVSAPVVQPRIRYRQWRSTDDGFTMPTDTPVRREAPAQTKTVAPQKGVVAAPQVTNFPLTIGTLKPGKSVTITFSVMVNNPVPQGTTSVSNQGTVSGMDGANPFNVLTDDPDVAGTNNPTVTGITPPPDIFVRDARAAEPASGSRNMVFTVVLSSASAQTVSVNFTTAPDTGGANPATAGTDYTPTNGTVTFMPNERVKTINVPVLADADAPEPNETFLVTLSSPTNGNISDGQAVGTITQGEQPGTVLISELRTSGAGAGGAGDVNDDFVEIYNNSDSPLTVQATDASTGYALVDGNNGCTGDPVIVGVIPNGTVIPARGHYLFVGSGYSLAAYAAGNQTLAANLNSDTNVALFSTADLANLSSVNRLDAVGFELNTNGLCDLLREGSTLAGAGGSSAQYSFVRKLTSGTPQDTNDNAADFTVVSPTPTTPVGNNPTPTLGAPGPENTTSPIQRNATVKPGLIDTSQASTATPNRERNATPNSCGGANCALGTLTIRRKFTNTTGQTVTRLRFRLVDVTTGPAPAGTADLRALNSGSVSVMVNGNPVAVEGTSVETPPAQANGGGLNSSLGRSNVAGTIINTSIANGASVNVQFVLGVQQGGSFRFFINVEALP